MSSAFGVSDKYEKPTKIGFRVRLNFGVISKKIDVLWIVLTLLAPATLMCAEGTRSDDSRVQEDTIHGLIRDVQVRSLLELESLTVEDEDGGLWVFEAWGKRLTGFTPSHLREHMVLGDQVTVTFHREDGILIVDDLSD